MWNWPIFIASFLFIWIFRGFPNGNFSLGTSVSQKKRLKLGTAVIFEGNLQYICLCVLFIANYLQIECNICTAILRILWAFLILAVIGSWGWINKCWENVNHNNCAEKVINYNISLQSIFRYEKWPRMTNMCIEHTSKT